MEFDTNEFKERFREIYVKDDSNCLFTTISILLFGKPIRHLDIRKKVCDFYKEFDFKNNNFEENSIEYKLQKMGAGFDREDNDDDMSEVYEHNRVDHATNMCKPGVWGNMSDIYAICILYKVNFVVCEFVEGKKFTLFNDKYKITVCNPGVNPTFYLLLKNKKHFSPLADNGNKSKLTFRGTKSNLKSKVKSIVRKTAKYFGNQKKQKQMEADLQKYIDTATHHDDNISLEVFNKRRILKRELPPEYKKIKRDAAKIRKQLSKSPNNVELREQLVQKNEELIQLNNSLKTVKSIG
jgi:hypothetical protein